MERLLLRVAEAAEVLGISKSKLYELISGGAVPTVRLGGLLRVPVSELKRVVQLHAHGNSSSPTAPQGGATSVLHAQAERHTGAVVEQSGGAVDGDRERTS